VFDAVGDAQQRLGHVACQASAPGRHAGGEGVRDHLGEPYGILHGREAYTVPDDAELFQNSHGVKQWAIDADTAQKLWTVSLALISQSATPSG